MTEGSASVGGRIPVVPIMRANPDHEEAHAARPSR